MTDLFSEVTETKFADPLLEFLTQSEEKERKPSFSLSSPKPIIAEIPAPKPVTSDFTKLDEVDGGDFLSLIAQSTSKKQAPKYSSQEDDLEKELNLPFVEPPRPLLSQMVEEFETAWEKDSETEIGLTILNEKAQKGGLQGTKLRGICWKIFLGVLTTKDWTAWSNELKSKRQDYDRLTKEYLIDPHKANEDVDLQLNNPLSLESDSPWQRYFQDTELKKQIRLDVIRVYPERAFFKDEYIREMMLRILFIYARENPAVVYKQGMHELLAPMLYILDREKVDASAQTNTEDPTKQKYERFISDMNDARYVEHDAYAMFNKIMEITAKWFINNQHHHAPRQTPKIHDKPFSEPEEPLDASSSSPIVQKCKRIQQELLRRADPELYAYLTEMQMEPQLYALRWVRLLLGREFHLEDVLILWDAIFSYGKDLVLVDYVIVAMLVYIRTQLLHKEQQECLHRLFNYPPVEDVLCLIEQALRLVNPTLTPTLVSKERKEPTPEPQLDNPLSAETATPTTAPTTAAPATTSPPVPAKQQEPKKKKKSIISTLNSIISEPKEKEKEPKVSVVDQQLVAQKAQIEALEQRQLHMANRLERIIYTMQNELAFATADESKEVREERRDSMLLALAELKQVRDTLAGLLPENSGEQEVIFFDPLNATTLG